MLGLVETLKYHWVPTPALDWLPPLHQAAQVPILRGLGHLQMTWSEWGSGMHRALCYGRHWEAQCCQSFQQEGQTCCSMLANSGCNLPTEEVEILLLVFSFERFFLFQLLELREWAHFQRCWVPGVPSGISVSKQFNTTENLPVFRLPFCADPCMNTAQKLCDENPAGIQINYVFSCFPVGMDCIFLQRGQMISIINEPKPWGRTCITFPWQHWQEWKILIRT